MWFLLDKEEVVFSIVLLYFSNHDRVLQVKCSQESRDTIIFIINLCYVVLLSVQLVHVCFGLSVLYVGSVWSVGLCLIDWADMCDYALCISDECLLLWGLIYQQELQGIMYYIF